MKIKEVLKKNVWAVIGASDKEDSGGWKVFKALLDFNKIAYPVSINHSSVQGVEAYKKLEDIPEDIDVAVFVVNPESGLEILDEVISQNIGIIWLQPGCRSNEINTKAKEHNITVIESCVMAEIRSANSSLWEYIKSYFHGK